MDSAPLDTFEELSLDRLHRRRSEKWSSFPRDVLPAFVAEMDFDLAPPIRFALESAIRSGDCGYASVDELPPYVSEFLMRAFGLQIDARRIFTVPDVMAGIAEALRVLTPLGSDIAINPPVYPPFFEVIRTTGRRIVEVPLRQGQDGSWDIDLASLERAFAAGARGYIICSPHNPVGRVWTPDELRQVASLARAYGVATISDEIHAPLAMPGVTFVPFLSCADSEQPCIALVSASKAWNVAGLKCGAMVTGSDAVRAAVSERLHAIPTEIASRVGHLGSIASVAAFRDGTSWLDALRAHLDRNRRLLASLLQQRIPKARYVPPQATYLAWIDCRELDIGSDPARRFLECGRVALEPGHRFGEPGSNFVRLNFGTSSAILTEIVDRMAAALSP